MNMERDKKHCGICGKASGNQEFCKDCGYLLKNGVDERTIRKMLADGPVNRIWKENEAIAQELAAAYYESVVDSYDKKMTKGDSKENFGYNTFIDGITVALDIVVPLLDEKMQSRVNAKIAAMLKIRKMHNEKKPGGLPGK